MGSFFLFSLLFLYPSFTLSNLGSCPHSGPPQGKHLEPCSYTFRPHRATCALADTHGQSHRRLVTTSHHTTSKWSRHSKLGLLTAQVCIHENCFKSFFTNVPHAFFLNSLRVLSTCLLLPASSYANQDPRSHMLLRKATEMYVLVHYLPNVKSASLLLIIIHNSYDRILIYIPKLHYEKLKFGLFISFLYLRLQSK